MIPRMLDKSHTNRRPYESSWTTSKYFFYNSSSKKPFIHNMLMLIQGLMQSTRQDQHSRYSIDIFSRHTDIGIDKQHWLHTVLAELLKVKCYFPRISISLIQLLSKEVPNAYTTHIDMIRKRISDYIKLS